MSTLYPTHAHTRGTTFSRAALVALPAGSWTPVSVIKTPAGQQLQELACNFQALPQPDADGNTHSLSVLATAAQTGAWPIGQVMWVTTFEDASAEPVIVPAVTRVVQVGQYTLPASQADNPLAAITDAFAPVLRGEQGETGADSTVPGPAGADGEGVPAGGSTGQVLAKKSAADHDTEWVDQTGGGGTGATNLAYTASPTGGTVTSDTGTDATLPLADGTNAGLMTPAQYSKLAGLPSSADAAGTAASAVSAHAGAADPHGDRAWASGQFAATGHNHTGAYDPAGTASSALSAHTGAADPHSQYVLESTVGAAGGVASLDGAGQVPAAQIPAIAVTELLGTVASQSAMLALTGQKGDWCIRTDTGTTWIITGADPSLLAGWTELVYPAAPVSSVAGRTGAVTLTSSDLTDTTAAGRALLDDADAAAQRATLGLGNAATKNTGTTTGTVAAGDDARLSDARTPTTHTHALSGLTQSSATTGQVPTWNGSAWAPATPSGGGVTAGFAIAMSLVFGG